MLNNLLRAQLKQPPASTAQDMAKARRSKHWQGDFYELDKPYQGWTFGIRTLLRLRYLAIKKRVLASFRQQLEYTVTASEIQAGVQSQLQAHSQAKSAWSFLLRRAVVYITVIALLLSLATWIYYSIAQAQELAVFKNSMPEFSDAVYILKAQQMREMLPLLGGQSGAEESAEVQRLRKNVTTARKEIMDQFVGLPAIRTALAKLLEGVEQKASTGKEMIALAKDFNDLLFDRRIPYYVSVVSETAFCMDLPSERFFARLFGAAESEGDICIVHALTVFDVEESRYYADQGDKHLALFTRRLDEQELFDAFLGLVHIGDDRAQVRLSNIQNASEDSLVAVYDGSLRSKLMPKGMPDVYGLESLARRLQSRVINAYIEEFEQRWWLRLATVWQRLMGKDLDMLALAGERLHRRMADVTAFHEVQHLVDQSADIQEPEWFAGAIQAFGQVAQNKRMREHILWELSAFFTHLAYAEELQGVLLNDFTSIALNPKLQDQPHYYSIRLLLPILHRQLKGELDKQVAAAITLADIARAYKALATHSEQIASLSQQAYQTLFDKPLPDLQLTKVPPRSTSRLGYSAVDFSGRTNLN